MVKMSTFKYGKWKGGGGGGRKLSISTNIDRGGGGGGVISTPQCCQKVTKTSFLWYPLAC